MIFGYFLTALFGYSAWISVNSIFNQSYIFVDHTMQGWQIISWISFSVQLGVLTFLSYNKVRTSVFNMKLSRRQISVTIDMVYVVSILSLFLVAVLWSSWEWIIPIASYLLGIASGSAKMSFYPFIGQFPSKYTIALQIGLGLSSLLSGTTALLQKRMLGAGVRSLAEAQTYVMIFFFTIIFFILVSYRSYRVLARGFERYSREETEKEESGWPLADEEGTGEEVVFARQEEMTKEYTTLFLFGFMQNGAVNSIYTYAALPYEHDAFFYGITIGYFVDPIVSIAIMVLPFFTRHTKVISQISLVVTLFATLYIIVCAKRASDPPFKDSYGAALIVLASIVDRIFFTLGKTITWVRVNTLKNLDISERGGYSAQSGSFVGALVFFALIQVGYFREVR